MTRKQQKVELGEALNLIDSPRYYEHYLNRKDTFPYLWKLSIKIAKKQDQPNRYFAAQWSNSNLLKTVDRLTELSAKGILKIMDKGIRVSDNQLMGLTAHMPTHYVEKHIIYYKTPNKVLIKMFPSDFYKSVNDSGGFL